MRHTVRVAVERRVLGGRSRTSDYFGETGGVAWVTCGRGRHLFRSEGLRQYRLTPRHALGERVNHAHPVVEILMAEILGVEN
jgi:hypothetical protein